MDRYNLDLLGVAECRYTGSGRMMIEGKTVLYSGRADGMHRAGVALFCSRRLATSLLSWEPVSERLLVARFSSRYANITIIMCYAPTEVSNSEKK